MIPASLDYVRPETLGEALAALADPEAKVLAGGQSLIPALKLRLARPSLLVDIRGLELGGISSSGGVLELGALATHAELERSELVRTAAAALADCAARVGDLQVRNAGTLGGSAAHADPAADPAAALLALRARLRLRAADGTRELPAEDFFLGPFTTALEPQELVEGVAVPAAGPGAGSAYVSVEDPASGYPIAGAAALVRLENGERASVSIGITGVGGTPFRLDSEEGIDDALAGVDALDDPRFDAGYRRHLAGVVVRRALERATERARQGGGGP
jgi:carbon-monoxide dehydrogenase medium subunit